VAAPAAVARSHTGMTAWTSSRVRSPLTWKLFGVSAHLLVKIFWLPEEMTFK